VLDLQGVMLVRVADGKITSSRDFWDGAALGRQLGGPR
jgi:ketosteroid isomerase-like protein